MEQRLNPVYIIPERDIKVIVDARRFNSNLAKALESWPIEPLATQLARANKKSKTVIDFVYAYACAPMNHE